ncbi:MAG: sugar porter family MFS transporter [Candidatus Margulisiibacteriota bacterium]|jgi:SP family galactose:H+ symporter-like MFS transporter
MNKNKFYIISICVIASLVGLLFGLDVAYVNGSLDFIVRDFNITNPIEQGKVAGVLLTGAALGAISSGWISRKFGRKKLLALSALIFSLFTFICMFAPTWDLFLICRFILGLAVGMASFVAPLYLAEIAPVKFRGALIALYQLMITIGIFAMFLSNAILQGTHSWRLMLITILIPSILIFLGILKLPESPRYLVLTGKNKKAEEVLNRTRDNSEEIKTELNSIIASIKNSSSGLKFLLKPFFVKVVLLGIFLQVLQQFSGINAIMYYSSEIFLKAGFVNPIISTVIVGLTNMLVTLIAIKYVDKVGRKSILYVGLTILILSCITVAYIFHLEQAHAVILSSLQKLLLLGSCLTYIFGFAVSLGPVIWILCSEIFPLEGRDLGMTITTATNWICNAMVGYFSLAFFTKLGVSSTFIFFGVVCFLGILLVFFFTPETKGVSLEEIEVNLKSGKKLKQIGG